MTEEERTCCILHKTYACLSADYFSNTPKWLYHSFFFLFFFQLKWELYFCWLIHFPQLLLFLQPTLSLQHWLKCSQMSRWEKGRHLYKRFVKLSVLKGKNSWSKSQQCWLKCLKHCLNPLINPASQYLTWINSSEMSLLFSSFVNIYVASPMKYDV